MQVPTRTNCSTNPPQPPRHSALLTRWVHALRGRWRWEQAKRVPESEQLDQLLGSLSEAVKAVAGFTRVSGVPDYRKDWDRQTIYEVITYVNLGKYVPFVLPPFVRRAKVR